MGAQNYNFISTLNEDEKNSDKRSSYFERKILEKKENFLTGYN